MSLRQRNIWSIVFLTLLLLALPAIGAVQYRWLTEVSRAEADRMRRAAGTAARQIRSDLSFEAAGIATLLSPRLEPGAGNSIDQLAELLPDYLRAWRERTSYPGLIESIRYAERGAGGWVVREYDEATGLFRQPQEPPASEGLEEMLAGSLTIPIPVDRTVQRLSAPGEPIGLQVTDNGYLLVRLDREYVATVVVPKLAADYLGTGPSGYEVAVLDNRSGDVLWASFAAASGTGPDRQPPDEVIPVSTLPMFGIGLLADPPGQAPPEEAGEIFSRVQEPFVQQWLRLRGQDDGAPLRADPDGLVVRIWHGAGSIDAAVRAGRNRNLVISYVVLALMAGAAVTYFFLFRRANRLREREREFVANVTHELRTPMAAMHAAADNLAEGIVSRPEQVREYGKSLLDEGRRLHTMIDQVLLYAGLQSGNGRSLSDINLEEAVTKCLRRLPGTNRSRVAVSAQPGLPEFRGDPVAIDSIIGNLVSNAVKHNPPGTAVTLRILGERVRKRFLLCIAVRDNGRGIPRKELARVREPFFRGAESQANQVAGSGLGLSLVQRIVSTYGGTLEIESSAGRGTTVTVRLPFVNGESDAGQSADH